MLKFSFVTHLFLAFRRGKGLGMSSILHSFETAPLKIFPPRIISLRTKKTRSLASPISTWRGMQTLPRHLESLSPSRDAPLPLQLQLRTLSPFSRMWRKSSPSSVDVSRNYPLETRYKTGSVAKLRLYYSGPVPELVLLIVTPFLRPSSGR